VKFDSELEQVFYEQVLIPALGQRFQIECQVPLRTLVPEAPPLRLDFLVRSRGGRPLVVFELDGHRAHFKDPAQQTRDENKDMWLRRIGVPVHRILPPLLDPEARLIARKECWNLVWRAIQAKQRGA
jgi:hypothetical protein